MPTRPASPSPRRSVKAEPAAAAAVAPAAAAAEPAAACAVAAAADAAAAAPKSGRSLRAEMDTRPLDGLRALLNLWIIAFHAALLVMYFVT